jgi:hypothetical protein
MYFIGNNVAHNFPSYFHGPNIIEITNLGYVFNMDIFTTVMLYF